MSVIDLFRSRKNPADRFEQLVSPHIDALYSLAYRLSMNPDDAEEVVQQLLTRLYLKVEAMEGIESLRPWLLRSLYNQYVDGYRKTQRHQSVFSQDEVPESARSHDMTPEEQASLTSEQVVIMQAVKQLNDDQRTVLLLHDAEGYTLVEVAEIMQAPVGTLKSRLHRARNRVKELTEMELSGCQRRDIDRDEENR